MNRRLLYLDSSALAKLVLQEPETPALYRLLHDWPERVSSAVARVELLRATRRLPARPPLVRRAELVLERLTLVHVDADVIDRASRLDPPDLRSLDAIHIATALSLGRDLGAFVAYDARLVAAAAAARMDVLRPA